MTIQQLQFFIAVSKYEKFTMAADELYISQSSLSKQIMALENELAVALFIRNRRRIELTEVGQQLLRYATRIVSEYDAMVDCADRYKKERSGVIRIGGMPILGSYGVSEALFQFESLHGTYHPEIIETITAEVLDLLTAGKLDLGAIRLRVSDYEGRQFRVIPLIDDEQVLVVNWAHPLAGRERIDLREAGDSHFIQHYVDPLSSAYQLQLIEKTIPSSSVELVGMKMDSIKRTIIQKGYVSLVLRKTAEAHFAPEVCIVPLSEPSILTLSLLMRKNEHMPACETLVDYLIERFRGRNSAPFLRETSGERGNLAAV